MSGPARSGPAIKDSDRLAEENMRMEVQLLKLRGSIEKERARAVHFGEGPIWKMGAEDKSLRSFASTVREKGQSKTKNEENDQDTKEAKPIADTGKRKVLRGSEAASWSKSDVLAWLESIQLAHHKQAFMENEIDGAVLLELGVDDLDYMGITALGSRKTLLKEVARLKRCVQSPGKGVNMQTRTAVNTTVSPTETAPPRTQVSIIHATPQEVSHIPLGIDEQAEHEAFRRAVEEWRNSGSASNKTLPVSSSVSETCMGTESKPRNDRGTLDEEKEHKAFVQAVEEWRSGKISSSKLETRNRMLEEFEENLKKRTEPEYTNVSREDEYKTSFGDEGPSSLSDEEKEQQETTTWDFESAF